MDPIRTLPSRDSLVLNTVKPREAAKLQEAAKPQEPVKPALDSPSRPVCDTTALSPDWEQAVDWKQQVQEALDRLAKTYDKVQVTVADLSGLEELQKYAASLGAGKHLLLSQSFLDAMGTDAKSFAKGKLLLENVFRQLSAGTDPRVGAGAYLDDKGLTFWAAEKQEEGPGFACPEAPIQSLFDKMAAWREAAEKRAELFRVKLDPSIFNSPADVYSQLARATSEGGVRQAMASAQQKISTLRMAISVGDAKDSPKAKAALAALEKAVLRGSGKIRDLSEEDDLRRRQKRAAQQRQDRKVEQLRADLKRQQALRRSREHGQITEGMPWFYYQEELFEDPTLPGGEGWAPTPILAGEGCVPADVGAGGGAVSFTPAEVTVAPTIEISL